LGGLGGCLGGFAFELQLTLAFVFVLHLRIVLPL
jgi:hypothetical protein